MSRTISTPESITAVNVDIIEDIFSGDGSTVAFTLSEAPPSTVSLLVIVGGVPQQVANYALADDLLTLSTAPPLGTNNISVRHLGTQGFVITPDDGTVSTPKLQDNAVTLAKLGADVSASPITAWVKFDGTGTPAIIDGSGISSIVDIGVGIYEVYFTTVRATTDFATMFSVNDDIGAVPDTLNAAEFEGLRTTSKFRVFVKKLNPTTTVYSDQESIHAIVLGGS